MKKLPIFSMIDYETMNSVFGNNPDAIYNYIERYITNTADLAKMINEAIEKKDSQLALKHFHQMKGPTGSIGFNAMYNQCKKAEAYVSQSDWNAAQTCLKSIDKELSKLNKEVERYFRARK